MKPITVVSLGPGPRDALTLGALSALEEAENPTETIAKLKAL